MPQHFEEFRFGIPQLFLEPLTQFICFGLKAGRQFPVLLRVAGLVGPGVRRVQHAGRHPGAGLGDLEAEHRVPAELLAEELAALRKVIGANFSLSDKDSADGEWKHVIWSGQKEDDATQWGKLKVRN